MNNHEPYEKAMELINSGAQVPAVDPLIIASFWDFISRIPPERRGTTAFAFAAVADGGTALLQPELRIALMMRIILVNALSERGLLTEYLTDEALKKKLFVAAASISFDKNDLGEALAHRVLREAAADIADKTRAEMIEGGLDPDFPRIAKRLIGYLRAIEP